MDSVLSSYENLRTGRTTGWTSAVGISSIVKAIVNDTKKVLPCSAILSGEYNACNVSIGEPAVIGKDGIEQILQWELVQDERAGMQQAVKAQKDLATKVKKSLNT